METNDIPEDQTRITDKQRAVQIAHFIYMDLQQRYFDPRDMLEVLELMRQQSLKQDERSSPLLIPEKLRHQAILLTNKYQINHALLIPGSKTGSYTLAPDTRFDEVMVALAEKIKSPVDATLTTAKGEIEKV